MVYSSLPTSAASYFAIIPLLFCICYVHVHINQTSARTLITQPIKRLLAYVNFFLSSGECSPAGMPSLASHAYITVSQKWILTCHLLKCTNLDLPSFKVHTRKFLRPQCISKISHCKINWLPIIRILDCWKYRQLQY
jgi:hypothetical protein